MRSLSNHGALHFQISNFMCVDVSRDRCGSEYATRVPQPGPQRVVTVKPYCTAFTVDSTKSYYVVQCCAVPRAVIGFFKVYDLSTTLVVSTSHQHLNMSTTNKSTVRYTVLQVRRHGRKVGILLEPCRVRTLPQGGRMSSAVGFEPDLCSL